MCRLFFPSLLLVATIAAFIPSCTAVKSRGNWNWNFRAGEQNYSTRRNSKAELTNPGVELFISPKDSFDFVPSPGYNAIVEALEQDPLFLASPDEAIVRGSDGDDLVKWATTRLDHATTLQKHVVPRPNESLAGKVLTVESNEVVVRAEHAAVLCHALEQNAHLCHKLHKPMDITEVTVSPNGEPSKVWVACHYGEGDDGETVCHVMNVGDFMFIPADVTTVGKVRRKELKTSGPLGEDSLFIFESHVMQSRESTSAVLEQLSILADYDLPTNSVNFDMPDYFVVTMMIDETHDKMIHDPNAPVKMLKYDENFNAQAILDMSKDNVVAITFYIPVENEKGLEDIVDDESKSVKYTMAREASLAKNNLRNKLSDYTNGPCNDMMIHLVSP